MRNAPLADNLEMKRRRKRHQTKKTRNDVSRRDYRRVDGMKLDPVFVVEIADEVGRGPMPLAGVDLGRTPVSSEFKSRGLLRKAGGPRRNTILMADASCMEACAWEREVAHFKAGLWRVNMQNSLLDCGSRRYAELWTHLLASTNRDHWRVDSVSYTGKCRS